MTNAGLLLLCLVALAHAAPRFGNYGTPNAGPRLSHELYGQSLDELHARCEGKWKYEPVKSIFPSFIMNHFVNNSKYDAFEGTDYTPHNLHAYPDHSHWRKGIRPQPPGSPPVQGGLCDLPPSSGGGDDGGLEWTVMRVGPFTSHGGYDWWQYAGHDALKLSRHLTGGRTVAIGAHYVTGVDAQSGKALGYPPLHVHHIHLVPEKPFLRYQWATPATASWRDMLDLVTSTQGAAYYVPNYVMEQHGEWDVCDVHEHVDGCFAESLPRGYGNLVDFPLDLEGEINDGRPPHSAGLTWWLEIGLGFSRTPEPFRPLSYAVLTEDHFGLVDGHQLTYENYHFVPSQGEWVNYYEGRLPTGGSLVRMKHHVHMNLLERAFFIDASAAELGLAARPLGPDGREIGPKEVPGSFFSHMGVFAKGDPRLNHWPIGVVSPQALGANSLAELEAQLRRRVAALPGGEARIICTLSRGEAEVGGFLWDRAGASVCKPWSFRQGQVYTSVSLLRYHGQKLAFAPEWEPANTTRNLPSHNQWNMYFESDDGACHYFVYSALIHDRLLRWRRHVIRELLLMMNWRVVAAPHAPLNTKIFASWLGVRRLAPATLLLLLVACAAVPVLGWRYASKRKKDD